MPENKPETVVRIDPESPASGLLPDIPPKYAPLDQQPYDRHFGLRLATPVPETHGTKDICMVRKGLAVLNDLSKAPTISELAKTLSWNETQLMRVFRQAAGTTVHNYQHRARMEKACDLLANSEMTITQIAMNLGYEYSSNFTTAFRKHFGVTPRQVRTGHTPIAV
jgi:AraC-like DNA-binding protein